MFCLVPLHVIPNVMSPKVVQQKYKEGTIYSTDTTITAWLFIQVR